MTEVNQHKAKEDGFEVKSVAEATKESDLTMLLMPDEKQRKFMKRV